MLVGVALDVALELDAVEEGDELAAELDVGTLLLSLLLEEDECEDEELDEELEGGGDHEEDEDVV